MRAKHHGARRRVLARRHMPDGLVPGPPPNAVPGANVPTAVHMPATSARAFLERGDSTTSRKKKAFALAPRGGQELLAERGGCSPPPGGGRRQRAARAPGQPRRTLWGTGGQAWRRRPRLAAAGRSERSCRGRPAAPRPRPGPGWSTRAAPRAGLRGRRAPRGAATAPGRRRRQRRCGRSCCSRS